jgi:GxxExxY protein
MADNYIHSDISSQILKAYYKAFNKLGAGFLEKVYQKGLLIELRKAGLKCYESHPIQVFYDETPIGVYYADIIVEDCIIIETKSVEYLRPEHDAQILNYLKATDIEVGILLNFGLKPEIRRKVFSREFKDHHKKS